MEQLINKQKQYFNEDETKSYQFRLLQLKKLKEVIIKHEQDIKKALFDDLGKSSFEAYTTEIGFCLSSIRKSMKHLKKWMKPKRVKTPLFIPFTSSFIKPEPLGSVLILGPYNYPFQLVIEPLIGAIAAGNTAIIKPSEFTIETEKIIKKIINDHFDSKYIHVVTGNHEVASKLSSLNFDHIFFTGSTKVGQIVYEQASKNLVPVTLELGGKSPTIVDQSAKIEHAAKRIVFGKFINAGQTCIAPDYIYAHVSIKDALIEALKKYIEKFYQLDDYGKIVSQHHFDRLSLLIDPNKVVYGNQKDAKKHVISPTILDVVNWSDRVMQEEIFGPILPILPYEDLDEVIKTIRSKDKPLALYLFSEDKKVQHKVFEKLSFGGGAINDTLMHVSNPYLPFGGVGKSGIGRYHGKTSFDIFSNHKGYVKKSSRVDVPLAYPPYSASKESLVKKILK